MGKRILAMALCLVVLITMMPMPVRSAMDLDSYPCDCGYAGDGGLELHADGCSRKAYLRNVYVVEHSAEEIYADWAGMDTETREAVLTFLSWTDYNKYTQLNTLISAGENPAPSDKVGVYLDGQEIDCVSMPKYEKPVLTAYAAEEAAYRWQILAEENLWVDIYGQNSEKLTLSYSLVASLLDENNQVQVRCVSTVNGQEICGDPIPVTLESPASQQVTEKTEPAQPLLASFLSLFALEASAEEISATDSADAATEEMPAPLAEGDTYTVSISFAYDKTYENAPALPENRSWTVAEGDSFSQTVNLAVEGFEPFIGGKLVDASSYTLDLASVTEDVVIQVVYQNYDPTRIFNITIRYLFAHDNAIAANFYTAKVGMEDRFNDTAVFPPVQGYEPYLDGVQVDSYTFPGEKLRQNLELTVYYKPALVDYIVNIYHQDITTDNYILTGTKTKQWLTGATDYDTDLNLLQYPGMEQLPLMEKEPIAADGTTIVNVYYDRLYYLVKFELDGGYGVRPIYARYGTPLADYLSVPTKSGYIFQGWSTTPGGPVNVTPQTVTENATYYAVWGLEPKVPVTVVFWGQDPDVVDENVEDIFNYHSSGILEAVPGTELTFNDAANPRIRVCGKESHIHGQDCNAQVTCGQEAHSHDEKCCTKTEGHTHTKSCFNNVGNITTSTNTLRGAPADPEEGEVYRRSTNYNRVIYINGSWYIYNNNSAASGTVVQPNNSCPGIHTHGDGNCSCSQQAHIHSDGCFVGACARPPHTHTDACYRNGSGLGAPLWTFYKSETITVKPDGTSVINVYYRRTSFTLKFYKSTNLSAANLVATISAKWGASISHKFTEPPFSTTYEARAWQCTDTSKYAAALQTLDVMPQFNADFTLYSTTNKTKRTIYYYVQTPGTTAPAGWPDSTDGFTHFKTVVTLFNYTTYEEEYHPIDGYIRYSSEVAGFTGTDLRKDFVNNQLYLYYKLQNYELEFHNGERVVHSVNPQYKQSLAEYASYVPDKAPEKYEPGSVEFAGWYLNPECSDSTRFDLSTAEMPADSLILYAKWQPKFHTVTVYTYKDGDTYVEQLDSYTVQHGSYVSALPVPDRGKYQFDVWYYEDDDGNSGAFDPNNIQITGDTVIYAKWKADVYVPYTIHFQLADGTPVADSVTGTLRAGNTRTFEACYGSNLYEDYRSGYFPHVSSHNIEAKVEDDQLTFTFVYTAHEAVPYTVRHIKILEDGTEELVKEDTYPTNASIYVTANMITDKDPIEYSEKVKGYMADAYQKHLWVIPGQDNVIEFRYTRDPIRAYYIVRHFVQNIPKSNGEITWKERSNSQAQGFIGQEYTADPLILQGYTLDLSVEGTAQSGTLTDQGLELRLYYTLNQYPYRVRHQNNQTAELMDVEGAEELGTAYFGQQIVRQPKDIDGYTCVESTQMITVKAEDSILQNEIIFRYKENYVTIYYAIVGEAGCGTLDRDSESLAVITDTAIGSSARAAEGYVFTGWYLDEACTQPVPDSWLPYNNRYLVPQKNSADGTKFEEATFYAQFEKLVKVTYEAVGGGTVNGETTASESIQPSVEDFQGATAAPDSDKFLFVGWYSDEACTNRITEDAFFKPDKASVTADTTYYAKFDEWITVSYEAQEGGTVTTGENSGAKVSEKVLLSQGFAGGTATPGEGYAFLGWYADEAYTTKVADTLEFFPAASDDGKTFYARFEKQQTVRYEAVGKGTVNGKAEDSETITPSLEDFQGATAAPNSDKFVFLGWYSDAACEHRITEDSFFKPDKATVSGEPTYYAKFEELITVHYAAAGQGTVTSGTATGTNVSETALITQGFAGATAVPAEGYVFLGWYSDAACTDKIDASATYIPAPDQDGSTFYAKFEKILTVYYKAKGEGTVSSGTAVGTDISESTTESQGFAGGTATPKEGYAFLGWYSDEVCTNKVADTPDFTPDVSDDGRTFYAWFEKQLTVRYEAVGPGTVNGQGTDFETILPALEDFQGATAEPDSDKFLFVGWYSDEACTNLITEDAFFKPDKTTVTADTTYYAKFDEWITVNYEAQEGGTVTTGENAGAKVSEKVLLSQGFAGGTATPGEGYAFLGWYADEAYTNKIADTMDFTPDASDDGKTFYARFEKQQTVHYEAVGKGTVNGKAEDSETITPSLEDFQGATAEPDSDKFRFMGWYADEACTDLITEDAFFKPDKAAVTGEPTYYAKFDEWITVSYEAQEGGTVTTGANSGTKVSEKVLLSQGFAGGTATAEEGYVFLGWYADEACTTKVADTPEFLPAASDDGKTFYARFEKQQTVHYEAVGKGTVNGKAKDSETITPSLEDFQGATAEPDSDKFRFMGWYSDEACTDLITEDAFFQPDKDALTGEPTYYAKFEELITAHYAVVGQGTVTSGTATGTNVSETVLITQGFAGASAAPADGYVFQGWYSDAACTDKIDASVTYIPAPDQDGSTFYAKFEKILTVYYKAKGEGTVSSGTAVGTDISESATESQGFAGSTATPEEGYAFLGWYSDEACTNKVADTPDFAPDVSDDGRTFYAWFEKQLTVRYEAVGPGTVNSQGTDFETILPALEDFQGATAAPDSDIYEFLGWYTAEDVLVQESAFLQPDKAALTDGTTYYAKFREKEKSVSYVAESGGTVSIDGETKPVSQSYDGSTAVAGEDYNFVGWYDKDGNLVTTEAKLIPPSSADQATYYARFTLKDITVYYQAAPGGTVSIEEETVKATTPFSGSVAAPNAGYKFVGWYLEDTLRTTQTHLIPIRADSGKIFEARFALLAGDLKLTKTVENNTSDDLAGKKFTFVITVPAGVSGSFEADINGVTQMLPVVGQTLTVILEDQQTVTIHELPVGEYAIEEIPVFGFADSLSAASVQIQDDQTVAVNCTNTYPVYYGDLTVQKIAEKIYSGDKLPDDSFQFTVTLEPHTEAFLEGRTYPVVISIPGQADTVCVLDDADDVITFALKDGQTAALQGIPVGGYTVTEEADADYTTASIGETGIIEAGKTAAAVFTNTYTRHRGDLTIHKTVTKTYAGDTWIGDSFFFTITGTTALADGDYTVLVGDTEQTLTVTGGTWDLTVEHTLSILDTLVALAVKDLPIGPITVTEVTPAPEYTITADQKTAAITPGGTATVDFVNIYRTLGDLKIGKKIELVGGSDSPDFSETFFLFTVTLPEDEDFSGRTYTVESNCGISSATVDSSGKLVFQLKENEYVLIRSLPVGSYVITEAAVSGFASSFHIPGADGSTSTTETVTTNTLTDVLCTNQYPVYVGDLTVSKTVTVQNPLDIPPLDQEFTITIQLPLQQANRSFQIQYSYEETPRTLTADSTGLLTLTLKHNQWATVFKLPQGDCTVAEADPGAFTTAYTVNGEAGRTTGQISIASGQENTVAIENRYLSQRTSLTVTKTDAQDLEQVFVYDIADSDGNLVTTVTVVGNGSTTVYDLPFGSYTVIQKNHWSWRFGHDDTSQTVALTQEHRDTGEEVIFSGSEWRNQWLNGNSNFWKNRKGAV